MRLRSLHVKNFRALESIDVDFESRVNVIVGKARLVALVEKGRSSMLGPDVVCRSICDSVQDETGVVVDKSRTRIEEKQNSDAERTIYEAPVQTTQVQFNVLHH